MDNNVDQNDQPINQQNYLVDINQIDTFIFVYDADLGKEVQDELITVSNDNNTTDGYGHL